MGKGHESIKYKKYIWYRSRFDMLASLFTHTWMLMLAHSHVHKYDSFYLGGGGQAPDEGGCWSNDAGEHAGLIFLWVLAVLKLMFDIEPLLTVTPTSSNKQTGREQVYGAAKLCWRYDILAFYDWFSGVRAEVWLNRTFVSHVKWEGFTTAYSCNMAVHILEADWCIWIKRHRNVFNPLIFLLLFKDIKYKVYTV